MNKEQAELLKKHIDKLGQNVAVNAVTVSHKNEDTVLYGVRYQKVRRYSPTERHVTEGGKIAGDLYEETVFDLLGDFPPFLLKKDKEHNSKFVLRFDGDEAEWYVSCYYDKTDKNQYHPLGKQFSLARWPHENPWHDRIDKYDLAPAVRVKASFSAV